MSSLPCVRLVLDTSCPGYNLGRVVLGTSLAGNESCWVRVVLGMGFLGTSRLGYELSRVRVILGTSCPVYESSWVRVVLDTSFPDPLGLYQAIMTLSRTSYAAALTLASTTSSKPPARFMATIPASILVKLILQLPILLVQLGHKLPPEFRQEPRISGVI